MIDTTLLITIIQVFLIGTFAVFFFVRRNDIPRESNEIIFERLNKELGRRDNRIKQLENIVDDLRDQVNTYISSTDHFRTLLTDEKIERESLQRKLEDEIKNRKELTIRVRYLEKENEDLKKHNNELAKRLDTRPFSGE
jgi:chromosome segregation ATPase